jgi:hydroxyacylglutathione hydrolase
MDGMRSYTGGIFETNCFLLGCPEGNILFDAPQECLAWLQAEKLRVDLLLLTHGHFDHVADAAAIQREFGCKVGIHADGAEMLSDPQFFKRAGFALEIEPLTPDLVLEETESRAFLGREFRLLDTPGHCPGSICFLDEKENFLIGGDVLFAGAIGRWDLPGGDYEVLMRSIREKLLPLADEVKLFPGHGPATTIGRERRTNPFLQDPRAAS